MNGKPAAGGQATVHRILIATKYRFIGDTLLAVPLLRAVSRQWPEAKISLLTGANAHELLENCPYVHDFIEFDPYRSCDQGIRRYLDLIALLRKRRFDMAFVCNRSFHSALTSALAGARERVGWSGFEGRDFLLSKSTPYDPDAPEIEAYCDLLRCIAPDARVGSELQLWVSEGERREISERMPQSGRRLIGIQPGATHDEKRWPVGNYARLAEGLLAEHEDVEFVLIGGPDERSAAEALMEASSPGVRERTTSLAGALKLRGTLAALTYLDLFIAGDTAIRHAAMALDIASIALFGPTSARKWGNAMPPRHVVLHEPSHVVADIEVDTVLAPALMVLSGVGDLNIVGTADLALKIQL